LKKLLVVRAAIAAVVAAVITFTQAHNASIGLISVLGYATAMVAIEIISVVRIDDRMLKGTVIRLAASVIILGSLIGYMFTAQNRSYELLTLNVVIACYGFMGIEVFRAARNKFFKTVEGRDHVIVAAINVAMLAVYLMDFAGIYRLGEVPAVGIFGAYAAVLAVFWGLKAFDPKQAG
jgi:ABC-type multidrug transport system fused ATPase/permease subunit